MKNTIVLFILLLASLVFAFVGPVPADPLDSIRKLPGSDGFEPVAAQTITVATTSATIIGTMPPDCRTIEVVAVSSDINYGASDVGTGTSWPFIPHGESKVITTDNNSRTPKIYFRIRGTATETSSLGIVAK